MSQVGQGASDATGITSRDSKAPLLPGSEGPEVFAQTEDSTADTDDKPRKRDFFRFGKKPEEEKKTKARSPPTTVATTAQSDSEGLRSKSPLANTSSLHPATSPPRVHPASPGRQRLQSASPRGLTPSTSQIFERNVQEDVAPPQASPHLPSHIITENHIPPALDASSEAITNSKLDPDSVEIVTHANHQPAAVNIAGATDLSMTSSAHEDHVPHVGRHDLDNVSNYGSLDVGDVRRLSFISFADVVHAEQELEEQRRDSTPMASLSGHPALAAPRSPSPIRSPVSSQALGTSPATSVSASFKGNEAFPAHGARGAGSPLPGQPSPLGASELNIETMRQALRKTGSGDLSIFRTGSTSAVGTDN